MRKTLIIGGRGDIGAAIGESLNAKFGDQVIATGRQDFDLQDVSMINSFFSRNGVEYDVLVHSAGWNKPSLFQDMELEQVRKTVEINLFGFLHIVKKADALLAGKKIREDRHHIVFIRVSFPTGAHALRHFKARTYRRDENPGY